VRLEFWQYCLSRFISVADNLMLKDFSDIGGELYLSAKDSASNFGGLSKVERNLL
jgi:hypothetical protein